MNLNKEKNHFKNKIIIPTPQIILFIPQHPFYTKIETLNKINFYNNNNNNNNNFKFLHLILWTPNNNRLYFNNN
jgi:hypothetical protein